jgi:hypothetical protein
LERPVFDKSRSTESSLAPLVLLLLLPLPLPLPLPLLLLLPGVAGGAAISLTFRALILTCRRNNQRTKAREK